MTTGGELRMDERDLLAIAQGPDAIAAQQAFAILWQQNELPLCRAIKDVTWSTGKHCSSEMARDIAGELAAKVWRRFRMPAKRKASASGASGSGRVEHRADKTFLHYLCGSANNELKKRLKVELRQSRAVIRMAQRQRYESDLPADEATPKSVKSIDGEDFSLMVSQISEKARTSPQLGTELGIPADRLSMMFAGQMPPSLQGDSATISAAISRLPVLDRDCVILRFAMDLKPRQIAKVLGITADRASQRVNAAKSRLARELAALAIERMDVRHLSKRIKAKE